MASPTYSPVLDAAINLPTSEAPTFVPVLETETKKPTFNIPGSSAWYSFTTAPAEMPVMNAATDAPHTLDDCAPTTVPILEAATGSPSPSDTPSPTFALTMAPTLYPSRTEPSSYYFETGPVFVPTMNAQTVAPIPSIESTPSMVPTDESSDELQSLSPSIFDTSTMDPSSDTPIGTNTTGTNETELCSSTSGAFFLSGEGNNIEPFELDVFTFTYELETFPRVTADDVLASLEVAFVDSLLAMLFPSQCRESSMRFLVSDNVVGISSEPADDATGGKRDVVLSRSPLTHLVHIQQQQSHAYLVASTLFAAECEPKLSEKNRCEIIDGKLSIFTTDGDTDAVMKEIKEALIESMNDGQFNDASSGITRVTYSVDEIPGEGTEGDSINDNGENNTVKPADDTGSMLGIGLSLSVAGVILFVVGASAYRSTRNVRDHDASTLQDGATLNGLSRFDAPSTDESYTHGNRELKVMPLSPAARSIVDNRYSASSNRDAAEE